MLNHDYLAQSLRRPLRTKDGGTLRTVADAANYIVALSEDGRRTHWDRTVQLLLDWRTHPRSAASSNSRCFTIGSSTSKCRHADDPPPLKWSDLNYVF
jgi:hypothetical protein